MLGYMGFWHCLVISDRKGKNMKKEVKITNSEWHLLNILWEKSPRTLMQIVSVMNERAGWSKSTCATMVRRMSEKGILGYTEEGKTKYFYPKVEKENVIVKETKDFLQRVYDGSIGMMMSGLVRHNSLTMEDIKELQEILKEAESKITDDDLKENGGI